MTAAARRRLLRAPFLPFLLLATSCVSDARTPSFAVSDSAGVRIAESTAPAWGQGEAWAVDTVPLVDIGDETAGPGHDLSDIGGAIRLGDGRFAVANGGTFEVRFYGPDGRYLGGVGREGDGPGEFRDFGMLRLLPGDSILVVDRSLDRITILASDGSLARTAQLGAREFTPALLLADGSLIARSGLTFGSNTRAGLVRDSLHAVRYDLDGVLRDSIGRFPSGPTFVFREGGQSIAGPLLFGNQPQWAELGEQFVFGSADRPAFQLRDARGAITAHVRFERPPAPVTESHRSRLLAENDPGSPNAALFRRYLSAMPLPSAFPAYADIATDADGHVWLQDATFPLDSLPNTWQVFDPEGRWLGTVTLPPRLDVITIDRNSILGTWRDELDVEHVRVHRVNGRER